LTVTLKTAEKKKSDDNPFSQSGVLSCLQTHRKKTNGALHSCSRTQLKWIAY